MMLLDCKMAAQKSEHSPVRGLPVTDAVIAVPSCFNKEQRDSILVAAGIANLNVLEIIDSPEATALGLWPGQQNVQPQRFYPKGPGFDLRRRSLYDERCCGDRWGRDHPCEVQY
eukprot:gnl/TRDRNA2_/TRDRNA2_4393_c0_seq1.p2 gnl/TRDRNA2_/TRDRNA2_4393_c0~~gnl/TRDRNA2_/TRDRNA2_4393_c0_seq1.p2  ORF type:complete len:114 (-),score=10.10 gnl/TRDRNA2_/TRDRNA2_4393_c0_seq1:137-478(-)